MVRFAFVLLALAVALAPHKSITLKLDPAQSFAPAHITITVHIERHELNRTLGWTCDSGDFYRSSAWTVEPEGPITFVETKALRNMPEGEYVCAAEVKRADGSRDVAVAHFTVNGTGH